MISYGHYCHCFYCDDCGYESEPDNKMYKVNKIQENSVDLIFSKSNNLKAFETYIEYKEL